MRVLLDTHALLWLITGDARLSETARNIYLNSENALYFSIISLWEICIKKSLEKISLKNGWLETIRDEMKINAIQWLAVEIGHCAKVIDLPFHHRDPFDRILVAQSMVEDLVILTRDNRFAAYGIQCIW